ncbi:MAG: hypothetical protein AAF653_20720, partial [Chloroflexota bacterium]
MIIGQPPEVIASMRHPITRFLPVILVALLLFVGATSTFAQSNNVKLNGPLDTSSNGIGVRADSFEISADGTTVVYVVTDNDSDTGDEIYSVPIGGGTPVKLVTLDNSDQFLELQISPNGNFVVYTIVTSGTEFNNIGLYSIPIGGGTQT